VMNHERTDEPRTTARLSQTEFRCGTWATSCAALGTARADWTGTVATLREKHHLSPVACLGLVDTLAPWPLDRATGLHRYLSCRTDPGPLDTTVHLRLPTYDRAH
jgi:hypothetical protein